MEATVSMCQLAGGFSEDESDSDWEDEGPDPSQKSDGWDLPRERGPDMM